MQGCTRIPRTCCLWSYVAPTSTETMQVPSAAARAISCQFQVVTSGAVWTLVYNVVWGVAWFVFMRQEWEEAVTAIGRTSPWTAEVWFLWVVLTVPMGVAIMAYASGRASSSYTAAVAAGTAVWLLLTVAMGAYSLSQSLSVRVIVSDSVVNLVGMVAASLAGAWSQREGPHDGNVEGAA